MVAQAPKTLRQQHLGARHPRVTIRINEKNRVPQKYEHGIPAVSPGGTGSEWEHKKPLPTGQKTFHCGFGIHGTTKWNIVCSRNASLQRKNLVNPPTNWDRYYEAPFPASKVTRRLLLAWLKARIREAFPQNDLPLSFLELGGGNSCFFEGLAQAFPVSRYVVADFNEKSLRLFDRRAAAFRASIPTRSIQVNLAADEPVGDLAGADVVFSTGLVEHFDPRLTSLVVKKHFLYSTKKGSLVIITAPTPTWLYRLVRGGAELSRMWSFPDERPLRESEILESAPATHALTHSGVIWPILLTQHGLAWQRTAQEKEAT
jgi:hypothetical protein